MSASTRAARAMAAPGRFARPSTPPTYAPDLGLEPTHIDLQLNLDIDTRTVIGRQRITLTTRTAGQRTLVLDAVDFADIQVDTIGVHSRYDGERLHLTWPAAPEVGDQIVLDLRWTVIDPVTGITFSRDPNGPRWAASDHETERARYWLPCVDHPTVRPRVSIAVRTDAALRVLSAGKAISRDAHEDGTVTTRWALDFPCPSYLLCLFVGDLVEADGGTHRGENGDVPARFFGVAPVTAEHLSRSFSPTVDMLDWITNRLGVPYPFPKYYQFAAPGIGGAMENISLVSWDDSWAMDARYHAEMGHIVDLVNLHEMAHTWFGDAVVCRDYAHAWLKEGWATYMESVWLEEHGGVDEMHYQLHDERRIYTGEADGRYLRPIVTRKFDSSWDLYDAHLYPGGAWRVHMLRRTLGDTAFWAGVTRYLTDNLGGLVETDDFRKAMERASGRSLARFFDQWIHSPGYPKLKVTASHDADAAATTLTVEQTQIDDKAGVPAFDLDLEFDLQGADGEWTTARLKLRGARGAVVVPMSAAATQILVDPRSDTLHTLDFDPGRDRSVRSVSNAPTVPGRLQAVKQLGTRGRAADIAALEAAYLKEPHWGVRKEISRALGTSGHPTAATALARLLPVETDPRVLTILLDACTHHRDATLATALCDWLDSGDQPYRATASALLTLGRQRDPAHLPRLTAAAKDQGWWGFVARGATLGLGATRLPEAEAPLLEQLSDPRPQVRSLAIDALADLTRWMPANTRTRVADILDELRSDPIYSVRMALARAMPILAVPAGHATLRRLEASTAKQDHPRLRRAADALGKSISGSQTGKLEKQLEETTDRLAKLEARFDTLEAKP